jgi:hypothetical protein
MTREEIVIKASKRYNSAYQSYGLLTRQDIFDFIDTILPGQNTKSELTDFLEQCTFVQPQDKEKLLADLPSYGI